MKALVEIKETYTGRSGNVNASLRLIQHLSDERLLVFTLNKPEALKGPRDGADGVKVVWLNPGEVARLIETLQAWVSTRERRKADRRKGPSGPSGATISGDPENVSRS
jgi:hypothetical protein